MEGGHEHEGKLDSEEDGDDDDQHQRRVVCVSLSLVLPEIGHDDHDDDNVNEMGRCDGCEMVGEVNQETPPDDTTCFPNSALVMMMMTMHLPPVIGFAAWSDLLAISRWRLRSAFLNKILLNIFLIILSTFFLQFYLFSFY